MTFLSELKRLKEAAKGFGRDTSTDVIVAMIDLQAHLVNHADALAALVEAVQQEHGGDITNPKCPICIAINALNKEKNNG